MLYNWRVFNAFNTLGSVLQSASGWDNGNPNPVNTVYSQSMLVEWYVVTGGVQGGILGNAIANANSGGLCGSGATVTPTPSKTSTPSKTATPTPSKTSTPSKTATQAPSKTTTPSLTPTVVPSATNTNTATATNTRDIYGHQYRIPGRRRPPLL